VLLAGAGARADAVQDPLESVNRSVFAFNEFLDRYALKPVARGYDAVMPEPVQRGVGNFFSNLYDVTNIVNSALQWRWEGTLNHSGRVLVNTTLGVAGLFDVATPLGLPETDTDFGQTLAVWGVPQGPYLVVPVLGPRTFRSGTGTLADTLFFSVQPYLEDHRVRNTLWVTEIVHDRASILDAETLVTGDRYIFVRDAYLQRRAAMNNDGQLVDDFSQSEESWDEEF